jgi:hypothetical protein
MTLVKKAVMKHILLFALGLGVCACNSQTNVLPDDELTGIWIETSARKDTLIFNLDHKGNSLPKTLTVKRGREINAGGYLVPKIGSGLYKYEFITSGDRSGRIDVINLLSSFSGSTDYAFQRKGNQIEVENFFELGFNKPATDTRTLARL